MCVCVREGGGGGVRDWSLIMGRGGYKTGGGGGGQTKFYPYKREGGGVAEKVLATLKGGGATTSFEVVLTWELRF